MPNWVSNNLEITGKPKELSKLLKYVERTPSEVTDSYEASPFCFGRIIPMPEGTTDFYHSHIELWGTKWNACSLQANNNTWEQGWISFGFDTAWSAPFPIIETLITKFPKLNFLWSYTEESRAFWGIHNFAKGKEIEYKGGEFRECWEYQQFDLEHHSCSMCYDYGLECKGQGIVEGELCETCTKELTDLEQLNWEGELGEVKEVV